MPHGKIRLGTLKQYGKYVVYKDALGSKEIIQRPCRTIEERVELVPLDLTREKGTLGTRAASQLLT